MILSNAAGLLILNRHGHELHFKLFRDRTLGRRSQPLETEMRKREHCLPARGREEVQREFEALNINHSFQLPSDDPHDQIIISYHNHCSGPIDKATRCSTRT
jgi:hypothetical protein